MQKALMAKAAWLRSRSALIGVVGVGFTLAVYLYHLNVPHSLSPREISFTHILSGVPYDAYTSLTGFEHARGLRLPSALIAVICTVLTYMIVRRWHGRYVGVLTAGLFATNAWMLHTGHAANGLILSSLPPLVVLYAGSWLAITKKSSIALILVAAANLLMLFIPGGIWFVAASLILLRRQWISHFTQANIYYRVGLVTLISGMLIALVMLLIKTQVTVAGWLGARDGIPGPFHFLNQWAHSVLFLGKGPESADLWLGHHPILDAFAMAALLLGAVMYFRHWQNIRVYMLGAFALIGSLLIALNGAGGIGYLLPVVYLIIGSGLTHLLHEWYIIFPRNPVARMVGTCLIGIASLIAVTYHATVYFVAWPRADATHAVYRNT